MEDLKSVFGDKSLTYEQFATELAKNEAIKLVNINAGNYVEKDKFTKKVQEFNDIKSKYDNLVAETGTKDKTYKDLQDKFDKLNGDFENMKQEKEKSENLNVLSKKGVKDEFADFVYYNVQKNVNDTTTFDKALEQYQKGNPQYFNTAQPQGKQNILKFGSGAKGTTTQPSTNPNENSSTYMNELIRGSFGK